MGGSALRGSPLLGQAAPECLSFCRKRLLGAFSGPWSGIGALMRKRCHVAPFGCGRWADNEAGRPVVRAAGGPVDWRYVRRRPMARTFGRVRPWSIQQPLVGLAFFLG